MDWVKKTIELILKPDDYLEGLVLALGFWTYPALFAVIFCETGLVVLPLLPGDSLLFGVGALAANERFNLNLFWLIGLLTSAAIVGDAVNYYLGLRFGERFFRSDTSRLFNKRHLVRTQQFYAKYGGKTIILARFIPIIRTFAPFVAGMGKMQYRRFALYNVLGGAGWVTSFLLSGYFLGQFEIIKRNIIFVAVAIIIISIMPPLVEYLLARSKQPKREPAVSETK